MSACVASNSSTILPTETNENLIAATQDLEVALPTEIAIPLIQSPIIFWNPSQLNPDLTAEIQQILNTFEENYSVEWVEYNQLNISQVVSANTRVIFTFENHDQLNLVRVSNPDTLLVYLDTTTLYDGLSTSVGYLGDAVSLTSFVTGYIAALDSAEWRVGGIAVQSDQDSLDGFINGVKYFCGLCSPLYPPYENYPIFNIVADGTDNIAIKGLISNFLSVGIKTIYLSPRIVNEENINFAIENGGIIVTNVMSEDYSPTLLAYSSINWERIIEEILIEHLQNRTLKNYYSPLSFSYFPSDNNGEGKLNFINEIVESLSLGEIDPSP